MTAAPEPLAMARVVEALSEQAQEYFPRREPLPSWDWDEQEAQVHSQAAQGRSWRLPRPRRVLSGGGRRSKAGSARHLGGP